MNIAAILSWYDEHPDDLRRMIHSLAGLCDQIIALDGAYALYPDAKPYSPDEQLDTIEQAARDAGLLSYIEQPPEPWEGNEVGKRAALFDIARRRSADWVLRIDADEHIAHADSAQARARLNHTTCDAAEVTVTGIHPSGIERKAGNTYTGPHRMIFRLLPALTVLDVHWRYIDLHTGRDLWGPRDWQTPALDLTSTITIEHLPRTNQARTERADAYYQARAATGIEGRL